MIKDKMEYDAQSYRALERQDCGAFSTCIWYNRKT